MEHNDHFCGPRPNWLPTGNRELLFGAGAVAAGLFFANMVIYGGFRLGFAIAAMASICLSWGYLYRAGFKGTAYTRAVLGLCLVIAAGFGRSSDAFIKCVLLLFLLVGVHLGLCLTAEQNRYAPGSARTLFDAPITIFAKGLGRMGDACRGVAMAFRSGGALTQRSGAVLAGLGIAVPALAVVIPLLISSDAAFEGLVDLLPDFELTETAVTCIFGSFCGLYFYTRAVALRHGESGPAPKTERRGIHALTMNTALGAVCGVYLVYLFSQLAYFVGGFAGILPEGFTAAEYARRGFFEMAWLCAINLGLITFGMGLVRRDAGTPRFTRGLCLFLGLVTLFLVASGLAKMRLYIGMFGLTRLRVLTMVIMGFLAATTVLVCVWLFVPKFQYMKAVVLVGLALGAAVIWADVDTQVAKYNVTAYLSGDLDTVDVQYLSTLGPGAVPWVQELTDCGDSDIEGRAVIWLKSWYIDEAADFRGMTTISRRALEILEQYQPKEAAE